MNKMFSKILPKGSVLVFSLIILSFMLVTALSLLSSSVLNQRAALSGADSARSFQIADSGVERTLYQIYQKNAGTIDEIASGMGLSCDSGSGKIASDDGWAIRFYDVDGNPLDCTADRDDIAALKSEGSVSGTTRAVEVAVAASGYWEQKADGSGDIYNANGGRVGIGGTEGDAFEVLTSSEGAGDLHVSGGSDHSWGLYASGETNAAHSIMHVSPLDAWNNMDIEFGRDVHINGDLTYAGSISGSSDIRLKENIRDISDPLSKTLSLEGVEFNWRHDEFPDRNFPEGDQIGVIAQDVQKVVPEIVTTDDQGYGKVDYSKLAALLIEAVKAQQKQIEELNAKVEVLEGR